MIVTLNIRDDEGNVVDTTTMDLTAEQISDIIDQASEVALEARALLAEDSLASSLLTEGYFGQALGELDEALASYNVIDHDD